jgi:hypothetical protein
MFYSSFLFLVFPVAYSVLTCFSASSPYYIPLSLGVTAYGFVFQVCLVCFESN